MNVVKILKRTVLRNYDVRDWDRLTIFRSTENQHASSYISRSFYSMKGLCFVSFAKT